MKRAKYKISVVTPSIRPDGLRIIQEALAKQTLQDFEWLVEISPIRTVDFNAVMNKMLRRAQGELIVSLQDFIEIPDDGLEKFWNAHKEEACFYTAPVVKEGSKDWRFYREEGCKFDEWEIDWGSAPLEALKEIGGFDEELDKYWGFDNVNVGLRADMANYKIKVLNDNVANVIDHDKIIHHPYRDRMSPGFHNHRLNKIKNGLKIDYLTI